MKIDEGRDCVQKRAAFDTLKNALMSVRITGMTWRRSVSGCGIQKGKPEYLPRHARRSQTCCLRYRWRSSSRRFLSGTVIETAKKALYTGHIGDGKIFVYDVENVIKVRTGEEGYDALEGV